MRITKATMKRAQGAERKAVRQATDAGLGRRGTTADGYQNFMQSVGLGTDNALSSSTYGFNPITRVRTILEWIYRGSWFGGMAIDIIADDMTRGGIEIQSEMPPEDVDKIQQCLTNTGTWTGECDVIKWGRLYGGCLGVIMIDGQDPSTPLDPARVGRGAYRGVVALDRWMVQPDLNDLVTDLGPNAGQPKCYDVVADSPIYRGKRIHHSRCFRILGKKLPYWQAIMENLWGVSIFEPLYDRMVAFDSATLGMAQLVFKAHVRVFKLKGLRKLLGEGGDGQRIIEAWVQMTRRLQGNESITLIDGDDEYTPQSQTTFTGIGEPILQLAQQLAGAVQIPLVRFFGMSPAGLNATGESDLRTYYDGIKQRQDQDLLLFNTTLVHVAAASEGVKVPKGTTVAHRHLYQLSEMEKSETFARDSKSVSDLVAEAILPKDAALKELRQLSKVTARGSNITDEMIKDAENEPPPVTEAMPGEGEGSPLERVGENGNGARQPQPPAARRQGARDAESCELDVQGIPIVVERWRGDERHGVRLPADYGYVRRTGSMEGPGEQMDVIVGPHHDAPYAWIVDHVDRDGDLEEHKVMLGFRSYERAVAAYQGTYPSKPDPQAAQLTIADLKRWLSAWRTPDSASAARRPAPVLRAVR